MRACIIGGGLAGALLAWRLAGTVASDWRIDLVIGRQRLADATGASGGAVRCFEELAEQRTLAVASMAELLASKTLREWAGYRETGSVCLRRTTDGLATAVAEIERALPGSVELVDASELAGHGWAGLEHGGAAVLERHGGFTAPDQLRNAVLADRSTRSRVAVLAADAGMLIPGDGGTVTVQLAGGATAPAREYDLVVAATGPWTPALLRASGLPAAGYRTKSIQFTVHPADGWSPPHFVDQFTGLFGRRTADGGLLLGLPTEQWDVDPDRPPLTPGLLAEAARLAGLRFPKLRLGAAGRQVGSVDCYCEPPVLSLRPVVDTDHRLFTFTGGSGGSVKTALAATRHAATQLTDTKHGSAENGISAAATKPTAGSRSLLNHVPRSASPTITRRTKRPTMTDQQNPNQELPRYHTIGVGAGPANLSLAALFDSSTTERIALFDRQPGPSWHNQLLHPGVRMQTSWLKDLVSMVDPRHELTFLNYLVTTGRMFALLNAQFDVIPRLEYIRYLAWAAAKLPNINYGVNVDRISVGDNGFVVHSGGQALASSEHLVIGLGSVPVIPDELADLPPDQAFIADELGERIDGMTADRHAPVAVVGGGQTGIEATMRLLNAGFTDVKWFGRRLWFDTIDDSPSANDVYRPAHVEALQKLSLPTRRRIIKGLDPTGDALTPGAMRALYQANYDALLELGHFPVKLHPGRDVTASTVDSGAIVLNCKTAEKHEEHRARYVVIATGRENTRIPFDDDLRERVEVGEDGELVIESDFSVRWKGMNGHQMYALNRARFSQGLTDANLTLLPVRAAMVLNSMFGREMFQIRDELCPVNWG